MQQLQNFLAIISLLEFLRRTYKFIKNKNNSEKVQSIFYHKNSLKILSAYLVGIGGLIVYINLLIYNIIFFSFQLSTVGMLLGMGVLVFLTTISILALSKFYHFHKNDVERYAVSSKIKR